MKEQFESYKKLRNEIDELAENLEKKHLTHMKCKAGCDLCCMDYNVFPVEFHYIVENLKKQEKPEMVKQKAESDCIFLKDHKCTIYNERPIICRTHGLPLLYTNDNDEWELSACELNFTEFPFEEFSEQNTFPQDKFNSKLFMLNKDFMANFKEKEYGQFDLVPLKKIKDHF